MILVIECILPVALVMTTTITAHLQPQSSAFAWQPPYIRYINTNHNSSIKTLQFYDYSLKKQHVEPPNFQQPNIQKLLTEANSLALSSALKKIQQTRSAAASSTTLNNFHYEGVPPAAAAGAIEAEKQKKSRRTKGIRFLPQQEKVGTFASSAATDSQALQSACNPLSLQLQATCTFLSALRGEIMFNQYEPSTAVRIRGFLSGFSNFPTNSSLARRHGMHIHARGDITNNCANIGDHFNPFFQHHGAPPGLRRHAGDLGNLIVNENGTAQIFIEDSILTLFGPQTIIGRSLAVHTYEDDLGSKQSDAISLTTGNVGAPLDCCVIGLKSE